MNHSLHLTLGTLHLTLLLPDAAWTQFIRARYAPYLVSKCYHNVVKIRITGIPAVSNPGKLRVCRKDNEWLIHRHDFESSSTADLSSTVLRVCRDRYAFDSWLRIFISLHSATDTRLLVHCAGIHDNGGVYLFPGRSGRGKSTITRLMGKANALSDELVLLSMTEKATMASSTPFWGELKKGTGTIFSAPVRGLFFLHHGRDVSLTRLPVGDALRRLLPTVMFFAKEQSAVEHMLTTSISLVERIPAYDLSFSLHNTKNDIIDTIRTALAVKETSHAVQAK